MTEIWEAVEKRMYNNYKEHKYNHKNNISTTIFSTNLRYLGTKLINEYRKPYRYSNCILIKKCKCNYTLGVIIYKKTEI